MCTSEEELYDERNSRYATHNLVEMPFDCLTSYQYTYVYAFSSRRQTLAIYHPEQAAERRCAFNTTLTSSQSIEVSAPVVMIKTAKSRLLSCKPWTHLESCGSIELVNVAFDAADKMQRLFARQYCTDAINADSALDQRSFSCILETCLLTCHK